MENLLVSPLVLAVIFFMVAFLYASVGLGGGSSYTALLALFGAGVQTIPTVSLTLNVFVTTVGSLIFFRYNHTRVRLVAPFLVSSMPMAYLGGVLRLPREWFYGLLLVSLLFATARIYLPGKEAPLSLGPGARVWAALAAGAVLGLVSGIVGIGGGVYLVPLIIILGLGTAKEAAACGAVFVWANSMAGLIARMQHNPIDMQPYLFLIGAVILGGSMGSWMGAWRFSQEKIQRILGSVLILAVVSLARKIIGFYL